MNNTMKEALDEIQAVSFFIGVGVFWHIQSIHGILWGIVYGLFWPAYVGYNISVFFTH